MSFLTELREALTEEEWTEYQKEITRNVPYRPWEPDCVADHVLFDITWDLTEKGQDWWEAIWHRLVSMTQENT